MPYTFDDYHQLIACKQPCCGPVEPAVALHGERDKKKLPVGFPTCLEALKIVIDEHMHVVT
jgi:hypothetical protein